MVTANFLRWFFTLALLPLLITACGGGGGGNDPQTPPPPTVEDLEAQLRTALDTVTTDTDFTLLLTAENGRTFIHRRGMSTEWTSYRSASTSKWVTATVILDLVNNGVLALTDHPQDYISFWPTTGNLSQIELRDLLSFTSGLSQEPLCINNPLSDFAGCVQDIVNANTAAAVPGTEFYYSSSHLQVAGLMAVQAAGFSSWQEIFDNFKAQTGLFANAQYDLPSLKNPRLAGGMHWMGVEYVEFLRALYEQTILTPTLINTMSSDQLQGATIVYTPTAAINEDWHYGFGNWIECHANVFNCMASTKVSSPGAYGAYPFIDYEYHYYGMLAREGNLGTYVEGYTTFVSVEPLIREWATMNRN